MSYSRHRLVLAVLAVGIGLLVGCKSEIGDKCVLSTDCSTRGDRLCDTSQPDGYCTQFNCRKNGCPDEAACVLFNASIPGCGYDDRSGGYGSRVARSFCVASCQTDDDCRGGYICVSPKLPPWNGLIQDDNQTKRTCLVIPTDYNVDGGQGGAVASPGAPRQVCSPVGPDVDPIDASPPSIADGGAKPPALVTDAGIDAADGAVGDGGDGGDGG